MQLIIFFELSITQLENKNNLMRNEGAGERHRARSKKERRNDGKKKRRKDEKTKRIMISSRDKEI